MTTAKQAAKGAQTQLAAALGAGLDAISWGEELTFHLYLRTVLPADGFVFWVRSNLLGPLQSFKVKPSSLHHTTTNQQSEDESFSLQQFVLTCQQEVDQLASVAPDQMWVAEYGPYRLAFSSRTGYYRAADVYHYRGDALYPALASQLVNSLADLNTDLVVSNSLPAWLSLNLLGAALGTMVGGLGPGPAPLPFTLYPSYLVPDNVEPPYGSVHIGPDDTSTLVLGASYDIATSTRWQLARDRVKITLYGVRNDAALDFLDLVQDFCLYNPTVMGLMNTPVIRDGKRGQTEFSILAQQKVVDFTVDYFQTRVRDVAGQLIAAAFANVVLPPATTINENNWVGFPSDVTP